MNKDPIYMVFDVESIGLHGEGFAAGWIVLSRQGKLYETNLVSCHPNSAEGLESNRDWVLKNVPEFPEDSVRVKEPQEVRKYFWNAWKLWKNAGAILVADCNWPVEARFLAACVDDDLSKREWEGPYPFIDLGSILLAHGKDPLMKFPRKTDETPEHNPLCDARQSARILIQTLNNLEDLRPIVPPL